MGSAPGEMGLADAGGRAGELRRSLDELATVLAHRPDALTWPVVLDKLAVAASQAAAATFSLADVALTQKKVDVAALQESVLQAAKDFQGHQHQVDRMRSLGAQLQLAHSQMATKLDMHMQQPDF